MSKKQKEESYDKIIITGSKVLVGEERDGVKVYLDQLDNAINSKSAFNIALSGGYGTGKSSIVKTYIARNEDKDKFKVISIGSFLSYDLTKEKVNSNEDNEKEHTSDAENREVTFEGVQNDINNGQQNDASKSEENKETNDESINLKELQVVDKIEESILKQLTYLNSHESMPQSDLKRINVLTSKTSFLLLIVILNIIIFCSINFNDGVYYFLLDLLKNINICYKPITVIYFIIILILLSSLIYNFLSHFIDSNKVKNVKTSVADIELNGFEDLAFNKKLFEIIYIFKVNKIEAVFFEDIDRFSNDIVMMVMEELKELNTILNNSPLIEQKVTFIYEFKDQIFKNYRDRSKFYDHIISVMPLSTPSNSIYLFDSLVNNNDITNIDLDLIRIICKYITDYRTMQNIVGDYLLFKKILDIPSEEENYLFATMAYKNYDSVDYDSLIGLDNKLDCAIKSINENIEDKLYRNAALLVNIEHLENNGAIIVDKDHYKWNLEELFNFDESGNCFLSDGHNVVSASVFKEDVMNVTFSFEKYMCKNELLLEIVKDVWNDCNGQKLDVEIKKAKQIVSLIDSRPKMIDHTEIMINKDNNVSDFSFDLIVSGYLNESYLEYISLPVNNSSMSGNDYKFILRASHDYDVSKLKLDNPSSVVKYIDSTKCNNLLNFSLLNYCFDKSLEEEQYFKAIFKTFEEFDNNKINFLNEYFKISVTNFNSLIKTLVNNYKLTNNLGAYYLRYKENKSEMLDISDIVCYIVGNIDLSKMAEKIYFFNIYFNDNIKVLSKLNLDDDKVIDNLKYSNVTIDDVSNLSEAQQKSVFENNLYSFSKNNSRVYNFSFYDKNKSFVSYALANFEKFYDQYYKPNKEVKINNNNVVKSILEQNISKSMENEIVSRENYKRPIKRGEKIGFTWRGVIIAYHKGIRLEDIVNHIINNKNSFFSNTSKIYPINDKEFNKKLFKAFFEADMYEECKDYYKALRGFGYYTSYLKYDYNSKYSKEICKFMISNQFMNETLKNSEKIIQAENISINEKVTFYFFVSLTSMYIKNIKPIKEDPEVLKGLLNRCNSYNNVKILGQLSMSKNELIPIYPIAFKDNKIFECSKSDFKKVIEPNIELFDYEYKNWYYYVKKKKEQ